MIYEFNCFREFLKSEFKKRNSQNPQFSAHSFASKLGLSQSYYSMIMSGSRKLSIESAEKIAVKLSLDAHEQKYFINLILKENANTSELVDFYNSELVKIKTDAKITDIDLSIFNIISDWKTNAVFVCLTSEYLRNNLNEISRNLNLTSEELQNSIQKLIKAKLVREIEGIYLPDANRISTPSNLKSLALRNFHKSVLQKGISAIDKQDISKRHVYGATIAANSEKLTEAKSKIEKFYSELVSFLSDGKNIEVYQMSSVLFKLENEDTNTKETL